MDGLRTRPVVELVLEQVRVLHHALLDLRLVARASSVVLFAKPLFATGFVESVAPYAGDGVNGPGVLISFDFDHPASKLAPHPTLATFFVGDGTYITAFVLDGAFTNCVRLRNA